LSEVRTSLLSFVRDLAAHGERPAVITLRGGGAATVTGADLAATSLRLAAGLAAHGLGGGETVAIVAPNSVQGVVLRLALGALGAVAVALDETASDQEIAVGLVESRARLVFASRGQAERLARILAGDGPALYRLDRAGDPDAGPAAGTSWLDLLAAAPGPLTEPDPAAPAVLLLGGGSGSESPPFCLSHENLLAGAAALVDAGLFKPGDRVVLALPMDQVYPLSVGLYGVLASGATLVLPEAVTGRQLRRTIRLAGATAVIGVPALYETWLDGIEGRVASRGAIAGHWFRARRALSRGANGLGLRLGRGLFPSLHREVGPRLRSLISGADRFDWATARNLEALGWRVTSGYTVSRAAGFVALGQPDWKGAIGRPLRGLELRAASPDEQGLGEIELSGPQVARDMELPCHLLTGDGWLRTGDLGTLDRDGRLGLAGPVAERITLAGESLFAEELEAVYGACPLVREIAVLARDNKLHGCVLPDLDAVAVYDCPRIEEVVRLALAEQAGRLPKSHALASVAILRAPLARSALGRLRRDLLPRLHEQAVAKHHRVRAAAFSDADRALFAKPRVREVWDWLQARTPGRALGLNLHPQLDLDIDSLGWLVIGLELEQRFGLRLEEATMSRMRTLREFMIEVKRAPETAASGSAAPRLTALDDAQRRSIAPPGAVRKALGAILHGISGSLMRRFLRLRVDGLENLPDEGSVIIAVNHMSGLDPLVVAAALPRGLLHRTYWAAAGSWPARLLGRALRTFAVEARAPGRSLAMAHELLTRGQSLVWFPEGGPLSDDGAPQRFLPGIGALVAESGVSVVPARIVGTDQALPSGRWLPRRRPVRISFGKPRAARELIARAGGRADFAGIAEAVREEVAALAADDRGRARRYSIWRHFCWRLEAGAAWLLYGFLAVLPLDAASGFCGFLARGLGPRLGLSRRARRNLERAFPGITPAEIHIIVREMWDNLGRSIGELVHLDRLKTGGPDPRIELLGQEHLDPVRQSSRPCIFFTAHLGNWEIAALTAALSGLPLTLIYRPANNPYVEGLIQHCRKPHLGDYVSKGADAVTRIGQAMQRGERLGMVVDQKTNNGVPAPFFGREAMTTPVLALCALNRDCILLPAQVERLKGARFRVTVHPPLEIARSGDKPADIRAITTEINAKIEDWVRQHPAQWLWLHNRWPD